MCDVLVLNNMLDSIWLRNNEYACIALLDTEKSRPDQGPQPQTHVPKLNTIDKQGTERNDPAVCFVCLLFVCAWLAH